MAIIIQMNRQVSPGSAGEYQADEQAGVAWVGWPLSGRCSRMCREAQLASVSQMSRQGSRGSAGEYQADEQPRVEGVCWRLSGR